VAERHRNGSSCSRAPSHGSANWMNTSTSYFDIFSVGDSRDAALNREPQHQSCMSRRAHSLAQPANAAHLGSAHSCSTALPQRAHPACPARSERRVPSRPHPHHGPGCFALPLARISTCSC
jgi:hypothetical protein